jgi:hypothetical protein
MSKIGVGVGDDFPVDDGAPKNPGGNEPPRDDRAEFEDWKRRRDAYRAQKDAWRAQREEWRSRRDEWKAQWKAQGRAWRDDVREEFRDGGGDRYGRYRHRGYFPFYGYGFVIRLLVAVTLLAIVFFAISHIGYILAGLATVAVLFVAWHHYGHDPFDIGPRDFNTRERDYSRPVNAPPPAPTPSVEKPNDPAK